MNCSVNIGHGVAIEPRWRNGVLEGVAIDHYVPGPGRELHAQWIPCKPYREDGWDVISGEPLTLAPSIACKRCAWHGYIRGGRWKPA